MSYKITLHPSALCFNGDSNTSIIDSALNANIHLEYSCKSGDCKICMAELRSGYAIDALGNLYAAGQKILTCSTKPQSDLEITANYFPELSDIQQKVIPAKIDQIDFAIPDVAIVKLRLPTKNDFRYLPGQYIDLSYQGVKRSYSIANAQIISSGIELHIRRVPNGRFSELLFTEVKKDSLMRLDGPKGTFFVRASQQPIIFLAGGTGFAPIKAMIEDLLARQDKRQLHIYWGMPGPSMFYCDTAQQWAANDELVSYTPVVSEIHENWRGRTGFVHHAVLEDFSDLSGYDVYACGSPLMIEAAKNDFFRQGLPAENFHSDAFTPAK